MVTGNSTPPFCARQHQPTPAHTTAVAAEPPRRFRFPDDHVQLLCDGKITRTGFLVLKFVTALCGGGGRCWAGDAYVAAALGLSPKTVANELSALVAADRLVRRYENGRRYFTLYNIPGNREPGPVGVSRKSGTIRKAEESRKGEAGPPDGGRGTPRRGTVAVVADDTPSARPPEDPPVPDPTPARVRTSPHDGTPRSLTYAAPDPEPARPAPDTGKCTHNGVMPVAAAAADDGLGISVPESPNDRAPRCRTTPDDDRRAARLKAAAAACGTVVTAFGRREWADQMHYLAGDLTAAGKDPAEIDAVLDWMLKAKPAKPRIGTAKEFRKHWNWLRDLMRKESPAPPGPPAADTPDLAKAIVRVCSRGWVNDARHPPAAVTDQIPAALRAAAAAVAAFRDKLRAHTPRDPGDALLRDRLAADLANPEFAVERWALAVRERLIVWADWSGRFPAWAPAQFAARDIGRAVAERATCFPDDYDRLVKEVLGE